MRNSKKWKKKSKYIGRYLNLNNKTIADCEILIGTYWKQYSEFLDSIEEKSIVSEDETLPVIDVSEIIDKAELEAMQYEFDERKKIR